MRRKTLEQLMAARREGRLLVRALDVESGEELLIDPASDSSPLGLAAAVTARADTGRRVTIEGRSWFLSAYHTPWEIVVIGAVHIAQALAALAPAVGYRVRVIDPRGPYATTERFPDVELQQEWPDEALAKQPLTARSALIALAHDPKLDDAGLSVALRSPAFYVGALGSMRTHARRLARLETQGFTQAELRKIHGPVGLAVGARSPAEIAIAVLADLVQQRRKHAAAPRIAGIVLAAGTASRMGRNKLVLPVHGKPMVAHAVEAAAAAGLDPVIVVTGHEATAVRQAISKTQAVFVQNDDFARGLSTSLRAGIAAVPENCEGAVVLLGDMPGITTPLIEKVMKAFDPAEDRVICVATAQGERGHPVLWGRQFFPELEALQGDAGGRGVISRYPNLVCEVEAGDGTPLADIDTPEALEAASR
jgi:CTP:molybdopterin cytidylyltransferase MocA/xanthine/CO dehydrogenase XdhC/CoxF family maturation factor